LADKSPSRHGTELIQRKAHAFADVEVGRAGCGGGYTRGHKTITTGDHVEQGCTGVDGADVYG